MDLSKAFDCVAHDLLIARLEAYDINESLLDYLCSYLSNRKQCVRINNNTSGFETIMSGVAPGSIIGSICLTAFLMTSFIFLKKQVFTVLRMTTP